MSLTYLVATTNHNHGSMANELWLIIQTYWCVAVNGMQHTLRNPPSPAPPV